MEIYTQRFGDIQIQSDEAIVFSNGLKGRASIRHWVLLADGAHELLYWLQAIADHELSIPVICPTEVQVDFRLALPTQKLSAIKADQHTPLLPLIEVESEVSEASLGSTEVLIINTAQRLGCQLEIHDEHSLQVALPQQTAPLRKSA